MTPPLDPEHGNLLPIPAEELAVLAELERRLTRRAWVTRIGPGLYRLRLTERGREVRRLHRPTRRQCARIGLDWVDGNA